MKSFALIMLFTPFVGFVTPDFSSISKALGTGNVSQLSTYLDESVEVAILEDEDFYDKEEAIEVLEKFFASNKPTAFNLVHQGTSNNKGSHYGIGKLTTSGNAYRVYLYIKDDTAGSKIQEIRFEES